MLKKLGDEIRLVDGSDVSVLGFRYPTPMAVIRLSTGDLFVWSPTKLSDELRAEVDRLGRVQYLIAPNSLHHLFIADWKLAYPEAKTYAPPRLRKKRKDIDFDGDLTKIPEPDWAEDLDQVSVLGNVITTEVVIFHMKSGTVLITDLIQHYPDDWFTGWRAKVARLDLMVGPEPSVPRKFRVAFTNRRAARDCIAPILAWPTQNVLLAHGPPMIEDGRAFFVRAFDWLTK